MPFAVTLPVMVQALVTGLMSRWVVPPTSRITKLPLVPLRTLHPLTEFRRSKPATWALALVFSMKSLVPAASVRRT